MLKKANIFREGDEWFMHLEYEYEDNRGKHLFTLPKVDFPYSLKYKPNVDFYNCMGHLVLKRRLLSIYPRILISMKAT